MSEVSFTLFIKLVEFDQETNRLIKEITTTEQHIQLNKDLLSKSYHLFTDQQEKVKKAQLLVKNKEEYMETMDDRQRSKEKHLDLVTSSKEYSSLMAEIEKLKKAQYDFEPELEGAWQQAQKEATLLKEVQTQYEAQKDQVQGELAVYSERVAQHKNALEERAKEREYLVTGVPIELLEKYKGLQTRTVNPIVPVHNGSCSWCAHTLPAQQLNRIHLNVLEQCKNCFRFLYEVRGT